MPWAAARRRATGMPVSSWPTRSAETRTSRWWAAWRRQPSSLAGIFTETHGIYPKDLWKTQIMTLGSVPGINTRTLQSLRALYGPVVIREIYGATEGMFGQQRDEQPRLGAQLRSVLL